MYKNQLCSTNPTSGRIFWITGLALSGKSTTARLLARQLRTMSPAVVLLDGDELREIYGDGLGHGPEDRRTIALRNSRLCRLLSNQGIDVVCATISLFRDCQKWRREHIRRYYEIYLRVPFA